MEISNRIKLITVISFILLFSFVSVSIFNYQTARRAIREEIVSSSLPLLRENIYTEIKQDIVPAVNIASMMSNDSFLKNWSMEGEKDPEEVLQYLFEIHDKYGFFSSFFVSMKTRNYYHYSGIQKTISEEDDHDVWFFQFLSSGKAHELDVDVDEVSGKLTIFINFRVEDYSGGLLGVTGVGIEMESFTGFLMEKQEKYERRIYFVDESGLIQAHANKAYIEKRSIYDISGIRRIADAFLHQHAYPINLSYQGEKGRVLVTSRYVPEMEWYLVVEQDEGAALSSARRNLWRTILVGLFTSILIIGLSIITINHFQKKLEYLAVTDELTKAVNRRELESQFGKAVYRYSRYNIPLSFIMFDIDHFKEVNDSKGHSYGDTLLRRLSALVSEDIRPDDLLARLGGDEFVIMLGAEKEEARNLTERIQVSLEKMDIGVTLSFGIAQYEEGDTFISLLNKADKALYDSKRKGRNRITEFG